VNCITCEKELNETERASGNCCDNCWLNAWAGTPLRIGLNNPATPEKIIAMIQGLLNASEAMHLRILELEKRVRPEDLQPKPAVQLTHDKLVKEALR
jgi:hypothetical protein